MCVVVLCVHTATQFDFVVKYFFGVFATVVLVGVWNGLVVLPVFLSWIGPAPVVPLALRYDTAPPIAPSKAIGMSQGPGVFAASTRAFHAQEGPPPPALSAHRAPDDVVVPCAPRAADTSAAVALASSSSVPLRHSGAEAPVLGAAPLRAVVSVDACTAVGSNEGGAGSMVGANIAGTMCEDVPPTPGAMDVEGGVQQSAAVGTAPQVAEATTVGGTQPPTAGADATTAAARVCDDVATTAGPVDEDLVTTVDGAPPSQSNVDAIAATSSSAGVQDASIPYATPSLVPLVVAERGSPCQEHDASDAEAAAGC